MLFFRDAGNKSPNGVNLYTAFLYLFNICRILSSSISICTRFSPPAISKFCFAQMITVSICFAPILVKERL